MKKGTQIIIDDSVIIKKLNGLYPSHYTSKLNDITREITSKYASEISSSVKSVFNHGNVISGLHKKYRKSSNANLRSGYITETYIARWLDEGTGDRWTKGRNKITNKRSKSLRKYRGKYVVSKGVFTGQVAQHERAIYADYESGVNKVLIDTWNKI
jgi:hypothetical protein